MKKIFLALLVLVSAASLAPATVYLSEPFDYPDGSIVTNGTWFTHSAQSDQTGQVDVASSKVNLTQNQAEDVSRSVTNVLGYAITNDNLYASFVVDFSALPVGSGNYFWHYRDTSTGFRARVFATTNGTTTTDTYRVGVAAATGTPVYIANDLALGTTNKLVVRYAVTNATATLWINPSSENSSVNRADTTDSTTVLPILFVCLRQSTASGNGMGTLTLDDLLVGTQFSDVQAVGGPPDIGKPADQHIAANTSTASLPFSVYDVETSPSNLVVTATSGNPTLVPNNPSNLTLGGYGANRDITVTPAASQQGLATIQLVVADGDSLRATNSFKVYVGEPTISAIANGFSPTNTVIGPLAFTVNDAETAPGSLTVTPASSNEGIVPTANISIANLGGQNRTATITPAADAAGTATITLTVNDGTWNIPTSFKVTFYPKFGLVLGDTFTYDDGSVTTNSSFFWSTHSGATGTTGQTQVLNGKLALTSSQGEDISANFTNFFEAVNNGIVLYSSLKVNFSALPTGNGGNYFTHYRDSGTQNFRARVFAATNGAAAGKFRIHISNGGFTVASVPQDLSLNSTYLVLTRYNVDTAESTVWVNPTTESTGGATATDSTTPVTLYYYAFRQDSGIGTLTADDLKVGTQWSDVWEAMAPTEEPLRYDYSGGTLTLRWDSPAFSLQAAPSVTGTYTNVPGASSPWPVSTADAQKYFRLKY